MSKWKFVAPFVTVMIFVTIGGCVSPPRPEVRRTTPVFIPAPKPKPPAPVVVDNRAVPPPALFPTLRAVAMSINGTVGVAVTPIDGGWTFSYRADQMFPQQSVSKLWVALAVFDAVDARRISLDQRIKITRADLTLFHQPIAQLVGDDGYDTNISELLLRAMTQSDNTANDSLLRIVGGPEAVRQTLARKGLTGIRFADGERALQSATAGLTWQQSYSRGRTFYDVRAKLPLSIREEALERYLAKLPDGAEPQAVVRALAQLKRGTLLSTNSTRVLLSLMNEAKTGKQRIAGGVPADWRYGHKTGTGQDLAGRSTGYNDVGIMTAPDGTSYAVAVMIASTRAGVPARQQMMQGVAAAIAANHRR